MPKINKYYKKFILFSLSVWSFIPIIIGILSPMLIILPIAYILWKIPSLIPGNLIIESYIRIFPNEPQSINHYIFIFTAEVIIFFVGIILFILGFYQLVKGKKQKELIITGGIYHYIRHPQNLGIILIALPFSLYILGFNDLGIRIGDIFSWLLFAFILTIYSNLEEHFLIKKFSKEYSTYQLQSGFFFPIHYFRKKTSKTAICMSPKKRYIFSFLGFIISIIVVYYIIELLLALEIISFILYF